MTARLSVRVYAEVNGPINVGITCPGQSTTVMLCFLAKTTSR